MEAGWFNGTRSTPYESAYFAPLHAAMQALAYESNVNVLNEVNT